MRRILLITLVVLCSATTTRAGLIRVPTDAADIANAASMAIAGDTIELAAGVYSEWGITLASGVTVRGATGSPEDVTVDLQTHDFLFTVADALCSLTMDAITVSNGGGAQGAIVMDGGFGGACDLSITRCRFLSCTSTGSGGAIQILGRSEAPVRLDLAMEHCEFTGCGSVAGGAAVAVQDCDVLNIAMTAVTADGCTGGVFRFIASDTGGTVDGCQFRNNVGGVLDLGSYGYRSFNISDSMFEGNTRATGGGAAISTYNGLSVAITRAVFIANQATTHGGAVAINEAQCMITNCEFRDNVSGGRGGAVYALRCPVVEIGSSTIQGNQAVRGGGVFGSNLTLNEVDFLDNTAYEGGAIYCATVYGGQVTLSGNDATSGGGLYLSGSFQSSTLSHWLAVGNTAGSGAAILANDLMIINLECCQIDLTECAGGPFATVMPGYSELNITNDGCVTATESTSWGDLKASFR